MIVKIKDKEYLVQWRHWIPYTPDKKHQKNVNIDYPNGGSEASLYLLNGKDRDLVYRVALKCFHKDLFSYEEGRLKTLTELLKFRRTPLMNKLYFEGFNSLTNEPVKLYKLIPSGYLNEDGLFSKKDRTEFWRAYGYSKLPSPHDLKGELERLTKAVGPALERIALLHVELGIDTSTITFIPDNDPDPDEPRV